MPRKKKSTKEEEVKEQLVLEQENQVEEDVGDQITMSVIAGGVATDAELHTTSRGGSANRHDLVTAYETEILAAGKADIDKDLELLQRKLANPPAFTDIRVKTITTV